MYHWGNIRAHSLYLGPTGVIRVAKRAVVHPLMFGAHKASRAGIGSLYLFPRSADGSQTGVKDAGAFWIVTSTRSRPAMHRARALWQAKAARYA